jgi:hypothetical protein
MTEFPTDTIDHAGVELRRAAQVIFTRSTATAPEKIKKKKRFP